VTVQVRPTGLKRRPSEDSGFRPSEAECFGCRTKRGDASLALKHQEVCSSEPSAVCPLSRVRGQTLDHRSDIFAFGAVLYEMLTGQRAFQKHSSVETLTAILKEDPPEILSLPGHSMSPGLLHYLLGKRSRSNLIPMA
jgi:serine/threonine protein kinase